MARRTGRIAKLASLSGLADANCFIVLGHDTAAVDAGAPVDILPLDGLI
ncbi:hypothetical protein NP88_7060 [Burkholderia cepacia]|nr:hypothetical protein NP88_7060 [Burkholderia cepacia]